VSTFSWFYITLSNDIGDLSSYLEPEKKQAIAIEYKFLVLVSSFFIK